MDDIDEQVEEDTLPEDALLDEPPMDAQPDATPASAVNLVPELLKTKPKWLEKACRDAIRSYKEDKDSLSEYAQKRADMLKLYAGLTDPMGYPVQGGKSAHLAILCRALLQLSSRIWDAVCPAKGDAIAVLPTGPEDEEPARRRQKHMNWQVSHKIPDWADGHRANVVQWALAGSSFRAKWYDPVKRVTRFDYLTNDEIVVAYSEKDVHPLMPKVLRITRIRNMGRHEIEELGDTGHYDGVEKLYPPPGVEPEQTNIGDALGNDDEGPVRQVADEIDGKQAPDANKKRKGGRMLLEQHTWLKLPTHDRMKPVILTLDAKTGTPLRLTIREMADPLDRMRHDAETKAHEASLASIKKQYEMQLQQSEMIGAPPPMEPEMPEPPAPPRMKVLHEIIHYRCFDNPDGFYGIGVGYLLAGHNELADELANEYLISAKWNNRKSFLLARGAFADKKGPVILEMGKAIQTDMDPEELSKGIKEMNFSPPSEGMWKVINLLREDAESLVANVSQLSGEQGPTNETKGAAQLRNANAMALVSVMARLYLSGMTEEVKLVAQDNALFMDPMEYYWVTEPSKTVPGQTEAQKQQILRDDYLGEFDFTFNADQRLQTKPEKIGELQQLLATFRDSPISQSPAAPAVLDAMFRALFTVMEYPQFASAMGPPPQPPQPPQPPSPMSQVDENAMFMNDQDHPVLPDDDDMEHIGHLESFEVGPFAARLSSTGKQLIDRHKRAHFASLYKKLEAQRGQMATGAGGVPGMEAGPGDGAGAGPHPDGGGPPNAAATEPGQVGL